MILSWSPAPFRGGTASTRRRTRVSGDSDRATGLWTSSAVGMTAAIRGCDAGPGAGTAAFIFDWDAGPADGTDFILDCEAGATAFIFDCDTGPGVAAGIFDW